MSILIKNGTMVTAADEFRADLLIEGEKIAAIGANLGNPSQEIFDAHGLYVFPGGIDQHTHFNFTFLTATVRGFETSQAALLGGTTTVVDFANQEVGNSLRDSILKYMEDKVAPTAMCDYAFHGVVFDPTDALFKEIPRLPEIGVSTIKVFMAYKGMPYHCNDDAVFRALQASREGGVTIMAHAENADMIDVLQKQCLAKGQVEPKYHAVSRPPIAETECTQRAIHLAALAGAPVFVVHVTCKGAMEAIRNAYVEGISAYGETCSHYLVLGEENLAKPDFEGAKYVCSPPLRTSEHREALWLALQKGWLKCVSSDHCGFDWKVQKHLGLDNFTKIPNGAPGLENRLAVMWTYGVEKGKISRRKFVDLWATAPAKINGLYPRKGTLAIGSDADLVLYDPHWKGVMSIENSCFQGVDFCSYEGMEQIGRPAKVFLRGKLVVNDGQFTGTKGQGRFVRGEPFGFCYRENP